MLQLRYKSQRYLARKFSSILNPLAESLLGGLVGVGLITDVKDFNVTCLSSLGQIDQSPFKKVGVSLRNEGEIFHVNTLRKKRNWVSESSYSRGITWDSSGQARTYQSRELTELERRQELGDISCSYPKKKVRKSTKQFCILITDAMMKV